jgi:hypothetical protein
MTRRDPTPQMATWSGAFGQEYTDRSPQTPQQLDDLYRGRYGVSRSELDAEFLIDLDRSARILEVGSNVGMQLAVLQGLGFHRGSSCSATPSSARSN